MNSIRILLVFSIFLLTKQSIASHIEFSEKTETLSSQVYQILPTEHKIDATQNYVHPVTFISSGTISSVKEENHEINSRVTTYTMAMTLKTIVEPDGINFSIEDLYNNRGAKESMSLEKLEEKSRGTKIHPLVSKLMQRGLTKDCMYLNGHIVVTRGKSFPIDFYQCSAKTDVKYPPIGLRGSIQLLRDQEDSIYCCLKLAAESDEDYGIVKFLLESLPLGIVQKLKVVYLTLTSYTDNSKSLSAYGFVKNEEVSLPGYSKTFIRAYPNVFKLDSDYYSTLLIE